MEQVITVSQVNRYIKLKLDSDPRLSEVLISGEISNFICHSKSGHFYFSLKDEESSIKAVMFKQNSSKVKILPQNGQKVIARGQISSYERDGIYQVYVTDIIFDGEGNLALAFENLKQKLCKEGLFDDVYKKKIPQYPEKIGLITSPTGAALQDMLNVFSRRYPVCEFLIYPAVVQGDSAANSVIDGLEYFSKNTVDVIIIARGGGSAEDLWCFNDETLARRIFDCKIPIISGIGHEIDFTIADFVADLRAPTPSAAAEICVPDINSVKYNILSLFEKCESIICKKIEYAKETVINYQNRPCLKNAHFYLQSMREKLNALSSRPCISAPETIIEKYRTSLSSLSNCLSTSKEKDDIKRRGQFASLSAKLDALSPLKVLSRGYSVVSKNNETVSFKQIENNDDVSIRFFDGVANAKITSKQEV